MSERLNAIYTTLEFIEDRLRDEISVGDIAMASGYSLYHFIRMFNQIVHHSPYDYLMRRRLSEAAQALLVSDRSMLDISLDFCFNNYETFSRAFKRMFAITPSQWRRRSEIPQRLLMPKLSRAYLVHLNGENFPQLDIVEREEIILAGLMVSGDEKVTDLWENLERILRVRTQLSGAEDYYGVRSLSTHPDGLSFFFAGIAAQSLEKTSTQLVIQTLPAGKYLRFTPEGSTDKLSLTLEYLYHTWLPNMTMRPAHPFEVAYFGSNPGVAGVKEVAIPVR